LKNKEIEAKIDATIEDIFSLSGVNTTVSAKIDSLQNLSSITKSELPETGPWLLNVRASSADLSKSPVLFNARLEGEGTQTVVDATIPDMKSPQNILAKLSVDAESLARLGDIIDKDLPGDVPLKLNTNIAVAPGEYSLEKLIILMGQGKILSDLSYSLPLEGVEGRKRLTGVMSIQNIDITPFFEKSTEPLPDTEGEVAELEKVVEEGLDQIETDENNKLFSSEPLAMGPLQKYDVDLKLDATDFTINEAFTIDGNAAITLDQGLLRVDPFAFKGQDGGTAKGLIELDASDAVAGLEILLDFNDFVFPRVGGTFDLDVDLDGEGESVAALMASLNGHFVANIQDIQMAKSYLSQYGAGLLSQVNPLSSDTTTLECAIARLDITDGMVNFEDKIAAQTTEVTWLGGGEINLKTEELELGIAPTARKAISSLTNVGLASLIHVGGTLAEPKIGLDKKDVAKKYAQYSLHIATAGLSFLAQNDFVFPRVGGTFDLDVDLDGEGESVAALMASLNGYFVANIQDIQMAKSYLSQYGAGLLAQVNPLNSDTTTLECAIARLDITDGMVNFEDKIAAQTTQVTWLGGGEINLKTEELELGIAPTARKAISSLTNVDLTSLVHVGGTLAEPKIGIDKKDVAKKYAKYSLHIATAGLSFLAQKAYDNRVSNIDQCKRILGGLEKKGNK